MESTFFRSFPKKFEFVSLCSFICLQVVYQLSGPVCQATWSGCPSWGKFFYTCTDGINIFVSVRIFFLFVNAYLNQLLIFNVPKIMAQRVYFNHQYEVKERLNHCAMLLLCV